MSNNTHVISVNIIFFISEILFHSRMPSYYLWEDPDCQGQPAADGLYQVAGGVWHEHLYDPGPPSLSWPVQSSLPYGHSQGPAGQAQLLHPWLVAQARVMWWEDTEYWTLSQKLFKLVGSLGVVHVCMVRGTEGHVGEHRVHHEQAGGQLGQDLPGQES